MGGVACCREGGEAGLGLDVPAVNGLLVAPLDGPLLGLDDLLNALAGIRLGVAGLDEFAIRDLITGELTLKGIGCTKEYIFAPRCRADVWVDGGLLIEVKKQRPPLRSVVKQLERYAATGRVRGIILAMERSMVLPREVSGVPLRVFSLNSRWGLAV